MNRYTTHALEASNATQVTYVFDSTLACSSKAELAASEAASRAGFDVDDCIHIGAAVREAVINAVIHGNKMDPENRVTLALESVSGCLRIGVRDEGSGWDLAAVPDPLAPENLLKSSGRGIFLIRAFMDEVHVAVHLPGSEIIMTKFVRGSGRDADYPSDPNAGLPGTPNKEPSQ